MLKIIWLPAMDFPKDRIPEIIGWQWLSTCARLWPDKQTQNFRQDVPMNYAEIDFFAKKLIIHAWLISIRGGPREPDNKRAENQLGVGREEKRKMNFIILTGLVQGLCTPSWKFFEARDLLWPLSLKCRWLKYISWSMEECDPKVWAIYRRHMQRRPLNNEDLKQR